jgi:tripartite-type tricarboxylate transporter receptor subunit TctC
LRHCPFHQETKLKNQVSRPGRSLLALITGLALALGPQIDPVVAQIFPDKPIKLIVPAAPGGPTDVAARLVGQIIPRLGQPAVIENRAGGGGAIGARAVAGAPPDGHTLLIGNTSVLAVLPAFSPTAGYDPVMSFAPVAQLTESYMILVVHPAFPAQTVGELIAYAKANPGKLNYSHGGVGSLPHLTGELFRARTGITMVAVPYKSGGESVTAVLSEQVPATFESITILLPLIREGKLRALAVSSPTRTELAPDLPTMIESGVPDFVVTSFNGVLAPAGTPAAVVDRLNASINDGLGTAEMRANIARLGAVTIPGRPAAFADYIAGEIRKWSAVGKTANVKFE